MMMSLRSHQARERRMIRRRSGKTRLMMLMASPRSSTSPPPRRWSRKRPHRKQKPTLDLFLRARWFYRAAKAGVSHPRGPILYRKFILTCRPTAKTIVERWRYRRQSSVEGGVVRVVENGGGEVLAQALAKRQQVAFKRRCQIGLEQDIGGCWTASDCGSPLAFLVFLVVGGGGLAFGRYPMYICQTAVHIPIFFLLLSFSSYSSS